MNEELLSRLRQFCKDKPVNIVRAGFTRKKTIIPEEDAYIALNKTLQGGIPNGQTLVIMPLKKRPQPLALGVIYTQSETDTVIEELDLDFHRSDEPRPKND